MLWSQIKLTSYDFSDLHITGEFDNRPGTGRFLKRARFTNYQILPCQYGKTFFYKELKNISMVTKYNLFTVNKWIFTTLKSILF